MTSNMTPEDITCLNRAITEFRDMHKDMCSVLGTDYPVVREVKAVSEYLEHLRDSGVWVVDENSPT